MYNPFSRERKFLLYAAKIALILRASFMLEVLGAYWVLIRKPYPCRIPDNADVVTLYLWVIRATQRLLDESLERMYLEKRFWPFLKTLSLTDPLSRWCGDGSALPKDGETGIETITFVPQEPFILAPCQNLALGIKYKVIILLTQGKEQSLISMQILSGCEQRCRNSRFAIDTVSQGFDQCHIKW